MLDAVEVCLAAGVAGITVHPRADRRHITPDDVRDIAAGCWPPRSRRRVQHRRAIRGPNFIDLVQRGPARAVHAGAGRARGDHQPGRLAGRGPETTRLPAVIADYEEAQASASASSSMPTDAAVRGRQRTSAPTASSSTPSRSPARSSRARTTGARSFARLRGAAAAGALARPRRQRRPRSRPRRTWCFSARCRTSTRCRSVTPSCRARSSSASTPSCASTWRVLQGAVHA